jgi:hypothetical protein
VTKEKEERILSDDIYERILTAIMLGKSKSEFTYELNDELNEFWDKTALEINDIQSKGGSVAYPSELD